MSPGPWDTYVDSGVMTFNGLTVRRTRSEAELLAIQKLRYSILWTEQRKNFEHLNHDARTLAEPEDRSPGVVHLFVTEEGTVVAAARHHMGIKPPNTQLIPLLTRAVSREAARLSESGALSNTQRFVVQKERRGLLTYNAVAMGLYVAAMVGGAQADLIRCESRTSKLFRRLGYRPAGPYFNVDTGGEATRSPMILRIHDAEHFKRVQSPFLPILQAHENAKPQRPRHEFGGL